MVKIAPKLCCKYLMTNSKGEKMLYIRMSKALSGMLKSMLLFYKNLVTDLEKVGFKINPYHPCIANNMFYGKQMTVPWHMDDLKVMHIDPQRVTIFTEWAKSIYSNYEVTHGKYHEYLGMNLDFNTPGVVKVSIIPYVEKVPEQFPKDLAQPMQSSAASHLFMAKEEDKASFLPKEQTLLSITW